MGYRHSVKGMDPGRDEELGPFLSINLTPSPTLTLRQLRKFQCPVGDCLSNGQVTQFWPMSQNDSCWGFSGKGFLAPKGEPQGEMVSGFLLDVTSGNTSAILEPASGETNAKMS